MRHRNQLARDAWRSGKLIAERGPFGVGPVDYLGFLEANGYGLSQVEQVMVGHMTVEDCYSQFRVCRTCQRNYVRKDRRVA